MTTKVKTHKRKGKNKVSIVKEHTRKGGKKMKKGAGEEFTQKQVDACDTSKCSTTDLKNGAKGKWGKAFARKAKKGLKERSE